MHHIPKDRLDKFKEIIKKEFGKDLNDADAAEMAARTLNLMCLLWDVEREFSPGDFDVEDDESWRDELRKKARRFEPWNDPQLPKRKSATDQY